MSDTDLPAGWAARCAEETSTGLFDAFGPPWGLKGDWGVEVLSLPISLVSDQTSHACLNSLTNDAMSSGFAHFRLPLAVKWKRRHRALSLQPGCRHSSLPAPTISRYGQSILQWNQREWIGTKAEPLGNSGSDRPIDDNAAVTLRSSPELECAEEDRAVLLR